MEPALEQPSMDQLGAGRVVVIKESLSGPHRMFKKGHRYLMDNAAAATLLESGYVRPETEREERIAKAEGHARPSRMKPAKAAKPKRAKSESER